MINEFYVITAGKNGSDKSLYKVGINVDDPDFPSIEKIAQEGPTGGRFGTKLTFGRHVGIFHDHIGLKLFRAETDADGKIVRPDLQANYNSGYNIPPIVAMFETQDKAEKCFKKENLKHWDDRYYDSSQNVISAIGLDHPVFILDSILAKQIK